MAIDKCLRENINEVEVLGGAIILDNPSFDNSIVGYTNDGKLVYDYNTMIEEYYNDNKDSGIEYIDAIEFIEYNTMRAIPYMGENAPIIMFKDDLVF